MPKTKDYPKNTRMKIGSVGVDSGQLIVGDPCYLSEWHDKDMDTVVDYNDSDGPFPFSYQGACNATLSYRNAGELGECGQAVAFSTAYGDGSYPVYATYDKMGRVIKVEILMDDVEDEEDGW